MYKTTVQLQVEQQVTGDRKQDQQPKQTAIQKNYNK